MKKIIIAAAAATFIATPAVADVYIGIVGSGSVSGDVGVVLENGAGDDNTIDINKKGQIAINGEKVDLVTEDSYNAGYDEGHEDGVASVKSEKDLLAWIKEMTGMKPSKLIKDWNKKKAELAAANALIADLEDVHNYEWSAEINENESNGNRIRLDIATPSDPDFGFWASQLNGPVSDVWDAGYDKAKAKAKAVNSFGSAAYNVMVSVSNDLAEMSITINGETILDSFGNEEWTAEDLEEAIAEAITAARSDGLFTGAWAVKDAL